MTTGFCICGHGRADHSSDDYDLTEKLGECADEGCGCQVFSESAIESSARLRESASHLLGALEPCVRLLEKVGNATQPMDESGRHECTRAAMNAFAVIRNARGQ